MNSIHYLCVKIRVWQIGRYIALVVLFIVFLRKLQKVSQITMLLQNVPIAAHGQTNAFIAQPAS